jgi:UBX domain
VLLPLPDGSTPSIQDYLTSNTAVDAEEESGPSDSTLIARSLANKMRESRGAEDDDEPMTTAAVRELRKLQKEKIYTHTLLRVKFPDRVCIQGYFHLRHSVLDVYEWVRSSLSSEEGKSTEKESGNIAGQRKNESGADFFQLFELYTSPPRCVLHPYAKSSSEGAYRFSEMDGSTDASPPYLSLADARLVPAALLHLSWGPAHSLYSDRSLTSSSSSASSSSSSLASSSASSEEVSMSSPIPLGQYLRTSLLSKAVSKENATLNSAASVPCPLGETSALPLTSNDVDMKGAVEGNKGDSGERPQGKESKPKWLKIGK